MAYTDPNENIYGYIKELSHEELIKLIAKFNEDIEDYENASTSEIKNDYASDRDYAVHALEYIDKHGLRPKK
jgi:hypothetical protein